MTNWSKPKLPRSEHRQTCYAQRGRDESPPAYQRPHARRPTTPSSFPTPNSDYGVRANLRTVRPVYPSAGVQNVITTHHLGVYSKGDTPTAVNPPQVVFLSAQKRRPASTPMMLRLSPIFHFLNALEPASNKCEICGNLSPRHCARGPTNRLPKND